MLNKNFFNSFLVVLGLLVLLVFLGNYAKYYVVREYKINSYTSCNPDKYNCFEVRPESEQFVFYSEPYAKVEMKAHDVPACLEEHTCTDFTCRDSDEDCSVTYCSSTDKEEWEICSNSSP